MYLAVLSCLLVAALLNRSARPFAAVMVVNTVCNYVLVREYGLFSWVPAVDAASFVALALLTLRRPHWWSFLVSELAFGAVTVHVAYWLAFASGLYFGHQYQIVLNGAFILSALILVLGGYDVAGFVGAAVDRVRCVPSMRCSRLRAHTKTSKSSRENMR